MLTEAQKAANKKYRESEKGKAAYAASTAKYRKGKTAILLTPEQLKLVKELISST